MTVCKDKKIALVWGRTQYEVKTIMNSTLFKPGQWLNVDVVENLCANSEWEVSIADNAVMQAIFGQVASHISFNPL